MASRGLDRFRAALATAGLEDTIIELDVQARTAAQAAAAIGCEAGQIVKSLLFTDTGGGSLLVLAAGDQRVDERRVAALHGAPVQMADAGQVRAIAGYAIGGVPPFGHPRPLATLIDRSLARHDPVWAAAGTPRHLFSIPLASLQAVTGGQLEAVGAAPG